MKNTKFILQGALIAALYVALTFVSAAFGLASGAVQIRLSELLCVLPVYTVAAVPGLTIGCFLANLLTGSTVWDLVFGTLATFIGVLAAYFLRRIPYLAPLPTILANGLIIPIVLVVSGIVPGSAYAFTVVTVTAGEIISCGLFGLCLVWYLEKHERTRQMLFGALPMRQKAERK